jgi:hypothetical protein
MNTAGVLITGEVIKDTTSINVTIALSIATGSLSHPQIIHLQIASIDVK